MLETAILADELGVKESVVNAVYVESSPDATSQLMAYFADWRELKVAVARVLKLKGTLLEVGGFRKCKQEKQQCHAARWAKEAHHNPVLSAAAIQAEIAMLFGKELVSGETSIYRLDSYYNIILIMGS